MWVCHDCLIDLEETDHTPGLFECPSCGDEFQDDVNDYR